MTNNEADRALHEDYRAAGFGQSVQWGARPALLLVDMVRAYFEPGAPLYLSSRSCLESAARLLAAARAASLPVVHTRVAYDPAGVTGGIFFQKVAALRCFAGDGPLGEIMPEVAPAPGEVVVVKQYASAFFGSSLSSTLTALRIDSLIVAGVSTSGCVRATAVDAMQHGFVSLVVRDAVGDRDPKPHEANLFDLQAKYAEVVSEEGIVGWLNRLPSSTER